MLRIRRAKARTKLVLPTERGNLRDPSNTRKALQQAYARLGYTDQALNTHVFRKTVATLMDEAGIPARAVADQLGHSKVTTTMDIYMGRKVRATGAALALADLNG
jgi:integrase